jgi:hypothetical protein
MKKAKSPDTEQGCHFLGNDRRPGRPVDIHSWSVKVGAWEQLCSYP